MLSKTYFPGSFSNADSPIITIGFFDFLNLLNNSCLPSIKFFKIWVSDPIILYG